MLCACATTFKDYATKNCSNCQQLDPHSHLEAVTPVSVQFQNTCMQTPEPILILSFSDHIHVVHIHGIVVDSQAGWSWEMEALGSKAEDEDREPQEVPEEKRYIRNKILKGNLYFLFHTQKHTRPRTYMYLPPRPPAVARVLPRPRTVRRS